MGAGINPTSKLDMSIHELIISVTVQRLTASTHGIPKDRLGRHEKHLGLCYGQLSTDPFQLLYPQLHSRQLQAKASLFVFVLSLPSIDSRWSLLVADVVGSNHDGF